MLEGDPPQASVDHRPYIFGLDIVRASAVLLVVLSHMVTGVDAIGVAGVELFFVLSGYLVGGLFLRAILRPKSGLGTVLLRFWQRRWARTIPNYALFFLVWLVATPPVNLSVIDIAAYALFLQNLTHPISEFFIISWSLAIEEWFYLVIPGATIAVLLLTRRPFLSVGMVCAAVVIGSAALRLLAPVTDINFGMRMVVAYRLDALAFGVLAAMLAHVRPDLWRGLSRAWAPALLIFGALCVSLIAFRYSLNGWRASVLFSLMPVAGCFLLARAVCLADRSGAIGTAVKSVSQWSYSMYLSHIPVFLSLYALPGYAGYPVAQKAAVKLLGFVLTLAVSGAVFRWFERPMLDRLSPRPVGPGREARVIAA